MAVAWFAVTSSNLAEYRYDETTQNFDVRFKNNPTAYRYKKVSKETVDAFRRADSKGSYFAASIKKGHEFVKLTAVEAL